MGKNSGLWRECMTEEVDGEGGINHKITKHEKNYCFVF
jgi:hypothetical protein